MFDFPELLKLIEKHGHVGGLALVFLIVLIFLVGNPLKEIYIKNVGEALDKTLGKKKAILCFVILVSIISVAAWQIGKPKPLKVYVRYKYRDAKTNSAYQSLENGMALKSGDLYAIEFTPVDKGHVYIFQVDSTNQMYRLFPLRELGNANPVEGEKKYIVPEDGKAFFLDANKGIEKIYILAYKNPIVLLDDYIKSKRAQQIHSGENDISLKMFEIPSDDETKIRSRIDKLIEACQECADTLTFYHN